MRKVPQVVGRLVDSHHAEELPVAEGTANGLGERFVTTAACGSARNRANPTSFPSPNQSPNQINARKTNKGIPKAVLLKVLLCQVLEVTLREGDRGRDVDLGLVTGNAHSCHAGGKNGEGGEGVEDAVSVGECGLRRNGTAKIPRSREQAAYHHRAGRPCR